jgi:hypothetical protein
MWRKRALCGAVVLALALSLFVAPALQAADRAPERGSTGLWASIQSWFQDVLLVDLGWTPRPPADSGVHSKTEKSTCDPTVDLTCPGFPWVATASDSGGQTDPNGG